jgi:multidrug efflux pump subunit AcrA (membrane-fusion protein)
MERGLRDALRGKDTEISNLQKQVADEQNSSAQRQAELESRVASLQAQRNELDAQLREARNTIEANNRKFEDERVAAQTRMKAITKALAFQREPEAADGAVLSVSKDLALGWIDIGSNQRLARGMRFRVVSGKIGSQKLKGWAEVTNVQPTMAEVSFMNVVDRFDPIVEGDIVFNPVFDPKGQRTAVLCGRFSGQFNETELKVLLSNMGITVQEKLGTDTDYLIVGAELFVDADGQALETPMPASDLPVYKDAEAQGTQIVSIKDLRSYFKF